MLPRCAPRNDNKRILRAKKRVKPPPKEAQNETRSLSIYLSIYLSICCLLLNPSEAFSATQITHTSKTDWQNGVLVNATWYPETQLQLDWQGSTFTTPGHSPSELWLAGWKYRRKITINNSLAYGLSDYQVWIPTSAFGANWTAIRSSAQPTMADFRFTPSTATTTIPYWIDPDTTTANCRGFWVKISTLPATSGTTVYMYYGNPSAATGSNMLNTGIFFDDFSQSSIDANKWARTDSGGSYAIESGKLSLTDSSTAGSTEKWSTILSFSDPLIIELDASSEESQSVNYRQNMMVEFIGGKAQHIKHLAGGTHGWSINGNSANGDAIAQSQSYRMKIIYSAGTCTLYVGGTQKSQNTYTSGSSSVSLFAVLPDASGWDISHNHYDNILIRRYAATEPTISSVSSEECPFFSTGTYRSAVIDTASKVVVSSVSWNPAAQPSGANLAVGVRVSSYPFSINSSTPSWLTVSNGQTLNWHGRYIQYQSTFTTTNSTTTPRLEDIGITYRVKPWQEKSITRTSPNAFGFGGGEIWDWDVPVKSGSALTITAYIRYNTEYGGSATKPKLTLSGKGISPTSVSATVAAENAWEFLTINAGTPSQNATLTLRAEGFSTNPAAKFYVDDISVSQ